MNKSAEIGELAAALAKAQVIRYWLTHEGGRP